MKKHYALILAGIGAGIVNGLLGAGGGMILVPLLGLLTDMDDRTVFASSIAIMLPICAVTLIITAATGGIDWSISVPYLIGSGIGGTAAGIWGQRIPAKWLHRCFGILIVWGGIRYLC